MLHLGWLVRIHVEEVCHGRLHNALGLIIWCHPHRAPEDLQKATVPIFLDVMQGGEAGINEGFQVVADGIAPMPVSNPEVAGRILSEALEALAVGLVIDLLPEGEQPEDSSL